MFLSTFQSVLFHYQDIKIDVKEDKTLKHDVNKINGIKQLHSGNHANSTNAVPNLSYFSLPCEHNIDCMTEFVTKLVPHDTFFPLFNLSLVMSLGVCGQSSHFPQGTTLE